MGSYSYLEHVKFYRAYKDKTLTITSLAIEDLCQHVIYAAIFVLV